MFDNLLGVIDILMGRKAKAVFFPALLSQKGFICRYKCSWEGIKMPEQLDIMLISEQTRRLISLIQTLKNKKEVIMCYMERKKRRKRDVTETEKTKCNSYADL